MTKTVLHEKVLKLSYSFWFLRSIIDPTVLDTLKIIIENYRS